LQWIEEINSKKNDVHKVDASTVTEIEEEVAPTNVVEAVDIQTPNVHDQDVELVSQLEDNNTQHQEEIKQDNVESDFVLPASEEPQYIVSLESNEEDLNCKKEIEVEIAESMPLEEVALENAECNIIEYEDKVQEEAISMEENVTIPKEDLKLNEDVANEEIVIEKEVAKLDISMESIQREIVEKEEVDVNSAIEKEIFSTKDIAKENIAVEQEVVPTKDDDIAIVDVANKEETTIDNKEDVSIEDFDIKVKETPKEDIISIDIAIEDVVATKEEIILENMEVPVIENIPIETMEDIHHSNDVAMEVVIAKEDFAIATENITSSQDHEVIAIKEDTICNEVSSAL
jgi:hypothetical protein